MASKTKHTKMVRKRKKTKSGQKRKRIARNKGTTKNAKTLFAD